MMNYDLRVVGVVCVDGSDPPVQRRMNMQIFIENQGPLPQQGDSLKVERDEQGFVDEEMSCVVERVGWLWCKDGMSWPIVVAKAVRNKHINSKQRQFFESTGWDFVDEK